MVHNLPGGISLHGCIEDCVTNPNHYCPWKSEHDLVSFSPYSITFNRDGLRKFCERYGDKAREVFLKHVGDSFDGAIQFASELKGIDYDAAIGARAIEIRKDGLRARKITKRIGKR